MQMYVVDINTFWEDMHPVNMIVEFKLVYYLYITCILFQLLVVDSSSILAHKKENK